MWDASGEAWPEWQDIYHRRRLDFDADLRTGQLCRDLGLAYDWLYPYMTEAERAWYVEGLDRRGIQPYLRAVEAGAGWVDRMNNWMTCIVGGLGMCGMALNEDHPQSQQLIDTQSRTGRSVERAIPFTPPISFVFLFPRLYLAADKVGLRSDVCFTMGELNPASRILRLCNGGCSSPYH